MTANALTRLHHMHQWIGTIKEIDTIMTPDLILRTHNDGEGKVDVDGRGGHGDMIGEEL